jgi:chromosome segregation ATPase
MSETWSVKVEQKTKDKINKMADMSDFDNRGEFIEHLLGLYNINSIKDDVPELSGDLDSLQIITKEITNIFTGMGEKMAVALREKDNKYQKQLEEKNEDITDLKSKQKELTEEYQQLKETSEKEKLSLAEEVSNLKDVLNDLEDENGQLKNSVETKDDLIYNLQQQKQDLKTEIYKKDEQLEELPQIKGRLKELGTKLEDKEKENNQLLKKSNHSINS